jgi:hypothetical protein
MSWVCFSSWEFSKSQKLPECKPKQIVWRHIQVWSRTDELNGTTFTDAAGELK